MIKIKTTEQGKGLQTSEGIEVTDENHNPIKSVFSINLDIKPQSIIKATVEVGVSNLELQAQEEMIYVDNKGNKYKSLEDYKYIEDQLIRIRQRQLIKSVENAS